MVFQSSDFDFLLSKGSNAKSDPAANSRDSLLLRFDPLLGRNVFVTQPVVTVKEEPADESFVSASNKSMQEEDDTPEDQQYSLNRTVSLDEAATVSEAALIELPQQQAQVEVQLGRSSLANTGTTSRSETSTVSCA